MFQQNPSSYGGHDESNRSMMRKSSKMDSIKAFVDANKDMQDQNYGRT